MDKRIGYYCWAGPDTIRMTKLKFFNPRIDEQSLLSSYDYDYLAAVKDKFEITDFWAMYSWGFADENEQKQFLLERLPNFAKLDLKVHAYLQGPNFVKADFPKVDWFARDNKNRDITYYRGRKVACINNPHFQEYKFKLAAEMAEQGFAGIYLDNLQMGQLGVTNSSQSYPLNFAGCNCAYCQALFRTETGLDIPTDFAKNQLHTAEYLKFRNASVNRFVSQLAEIVHSKKLEFGSNSFDPKFNTYQTLGTDLNYLVTVQDYLLFENHSLPSATKNNYYIHELAQKYRKPVFLVSYKHGIGADAKYAPSDFNNIYSEDEQLAFYACIKGSEYFTAGEWHNLYINDYPKPQTHSPLDFKHSENQTHSARVSPNLLTRFIIKNYFNLLFTLFMEVQVIRRAFLFVAVKVLADN